MASLQDVRVCSHSSPKFTMLEPSNVLNEQDRLPDSSSPTLALVHPTEDEKIAQFYCNGISWRGPLSLDSYIEREFFLANQDFTKDGGLTYWILTDTSVPEDQRLTLSGCESFRKRALLARNDTIRDVVCHGIGSVFCPPKHRRRGYAQRMMRELGTRLQTWQSEFKGDPKREIMFSILYSDIGKDFYAAQGWQPFPSSHVSVSAQGNALGNGRSLDLPAARPLFSSDIAELCQIDERLIRQSVRSAAHNDHKDKTFVALLPDVQTIRWHHAREDFLAKKLHGRTAEIKGAIVGTEPGKRVWCYWTRTWHNEDPTDSKDNVLHILRIVTEDRGLFDWEHGDNGDVESYVPSIAALLAMARSEAKAWCLAEVETWNPTDAVQRAAILLDEGAKLVHRDKESIASLQWYGNVANSDAPGEKVEWIGNEKYGWC